ncbi:MAG: metal-dependent transcriptional regulator [Halodesulfurarchaeum sp.]
MTEPIALSDRAEPIIPVPNRRVGRYLLSILRLADGPTDEVRTSDIANDLKVTPASVTDMISRMASNDLVEHEPYGGVVLTPRGREAATHLEWRQCVFQTFFEAVSGKSLPREQSYRASFELPLDVLRVLGDIIECPCHDHCAETVWSSDRPREDVRSAASRNTASLLHAVGTQSER